MSPSIPAIQDSWNWFAFDVALKATLILLLAAIPAVASRTASAAWRHRVWSVAFTGIVLLPLLQWATPGLLWQVLPEQWRTVNSNDFVVDASDEELRQARVARAATDVQRVRGMSAESLRATATRSTDPTTLDSSPLESAAQFGRPTEAATTAARISTAIEPHVNWLRIVWGMGVVSALMPLLLGLLGNVFWKRRGMRVDEPNLHGRIALLARRIGLKRSPLVLLGGDRQMPMTFGWWRPTVVLPIEALDWSRKRLDSVVLHELAHVRRGDVPLQLIARAACCLYWFNPMMWWAIAKMRLDREVACDDCVLNAGYAAPDYATELLGVAREHVSRPLCWSAALSMARKSQLEGRLLAVLDVNRRRTPVGTYRMAVLSGLAIVIVTGLATVRPSFTAESTRRQVEPRQVESKTSERDLCVVTGAILTANGQPAADVSVEVVMHDSRGNWTRELPDEQAVDQLETWSDSDGRFQLAVPRDVSRPRVKVVLVASASGEFPIVREVDTRRTRIDMKLEFLKTKTIVVQLVDSIGNPITGVVPEIQSLNRNSEYLPAPHPKGRAVVDSWPAFSRSDEQGFSKADLPVDTERITLIVADDRAGSHRVPLEVGSDPVSVVLESPTFITGSIINPEGVPVAGAEIVVLEFPFRVTRTKPDGSFRIARGSGGRPIFRDGQSTIHIYPPRDSDLLFQAIEWKWPNDGLGDATLTVKLPRGIFIEGRVVEAGSGEPVRGARLAYEPQHESNPYFDQRLVNRFTGADMRYTTDADGRFRMPVSPGTGSLTINARTLDYLPQEFSMGEKWYGEPGMQREYYDGIQKLDLKEGATSDRLLIELRRGETLRKSVVRPDGSPATGKAYAASYLRDKNSIRGWLPDLLVNHGQLELPGFEPNSSTPIFIHDIEADCGAVISSLPGHVSPYSQEFKLKRCGSAKFRFVNHDGEPLQDYQPRLHLVFNEGAPSTHRIEPNQPIWSDTIIWENVVRPDELPRTDADGRVVVGGLIPGANYQLYFINKEGSWDEGYPFQVSSGETTDVGEIKLFQRN